MPLVSINLLNKDQKTLLKSCIDSVLHQTYAHIEILIIDNGSTDGSLEFIKKEFPQLQLLRNNSNEGYAQAHNKGISICSGEYIMLLNIDVILTETFVEEMVKAMEQEDKIGMVQARLYQPGLKEGEKNFDSTGISIGRSRRNYDRGYGRIDRGQYNSVEYIFAASGAASLYKRKMLEDIKIGDEYFDTDFFMFREEIDLAWRAQLRGWKCFYTPKAIGYHLRGYSPQSRKSVAVFLKQLQFRNRYLMIIKNDFVSNFLQDLPYIAWFEIRAFFYALLVEPFLLKSYLDALKLLPRMLKKRRIIMQKKTVGQSYIRQWFQ